MTKVVKRVLSAIPVALGVAVIAFLFLRFLPGDPVEIMLGDANVGQREVEALRSAMNLDRPVLEQLGLFLAGIVRGDFGWSIVKNQPVAQLIVDTLPATIELTFVTILFALIIALPVGIISALKAGSLLDRVVLGSTLLGVSMPAFWFGLLLILLFSVELGLLPTSGRIAATMFIPERTGFMLLDTLLAGNLQAFGNALKHLVLPAFTLGVVFAVVLARVVRSSMVEIMGRDYVTTARSKGMPERRVVIKHALRNALIPALTVTGLQIGELLGGNMIVETIFGWPGLGRLVVSSIFARDYVVVQAAVMLYALTYVAVNLIVDVLYTYLNPRIAL